MERAALTEKSAPSADSQVDQPVDALSKDKVFDLLKNRRRRQVYRYLVSNDGRATRSELAEHIAAMENGVEEDGLHWKQRKRVYTSLYQHHLPKLEQADIVQYDRDSGLFTLSENSHLFEVYLRSPTSGPSLWRLGHLVLTVLCGVVVLALQLASPPWPVTAELAVTLILATFFLFSLAHVSAQRNRRQNWRLRTNAPDERVDEP